MRVNFSTNDVSRVQSVDYKNKKQYVGNPSLLNFKVQDAFSPSFTGLRSALSKIFRKPALKPATAPNLISAQPVGTAVAAVKKELAKSKKILREVYKKYDISNITGVYSNLAQGNFSYLKRVLNDENADFVSALLKKEKFSESDNYNVGTFLYSVAEIAERYTKHPKTRPLMEKVLAETVDGKPRFDFDQFKHMFSGMGYGHTEAQNDFISMMIDAKGLDGKPRFIHYAISDNLRHVTAENRPAVDYLLGLRTMEAEDIKPERLAQIVKETESGKIAEKIKAETVIKEAYFIDSWAGGLGEILEHFTSEKMPVLKTLVNEGFDKDSTARILKHYTPENHELFEKALNAVDGEGKRCLDGYDIARILEHSKPAAKPATNT